MFPRPCARLLKQDYLLHRFPSTILHCPHTTHRVCPHPPRVPCPRVCRSIQFVLPALGSFQSYVSVPPCQGGGVWLTCGCTRRRETLLTHGLDASSLGLCSLAQWCARYVPTFRCQLPLPFPNAIHNIP